MACHMLQWRREHGYTQLALAQKLNQSASTISLKERGLMPWQQSDLQALHDEFGLSSDFVLGLDGEAECEDVELEVA